MNQSDLIELHNCLTRCFSPGTQCIIKLESDRTSINRRRFNCNSNQLLSIDNDTRYAWAEVLCVYTDVVGRTHLIAGRVVKGQIEPLSTIDSGGWASGRMRGEWKADGRVSWLPRRIWHWLLINIETVAIRYAAISMTPLLTETGVLSPGNFDNGVCV